MKTSDSITNLLRSLIAAQLNIAAGILKDGENPNFSSQYATLGAVITATKSVLLAENIIVLQSPGEYIDHKVSVTTRICHGSGEWIEDVCSAPVEHVDPQGFGSAVSYLRRYALTAILGLYQSDDDANLASPRTATASTAQTKSSPVKASAPAVAASTPATTDEAMATKLKQWKNNIANATPERLLLAKETAKAVFTGTALKEILSLIDRNLVAANEVVDPFSM